MERVLEETQDSSGPASGPQERDDKETRRIIRKIDLRLLPTLAIIYAFALIDRVNLPNVSDDRLLHDWNWKLTTIRHV